MQPLGRGQRLRPRRPRPQRGLSLAGPVGHPLERTGRCSPRWKAARVHELSDKSDQKRADQEPGNFPGYT